VGIEIRARSVPPAGPDGPLRRRFPRPVIVDRAVAPWQVKLAGQLLDPQGRHLRVPYGTWDSPGAEDALGGLLARPRDRPGASAAAP
jgi:hypothetical protein